MKSRKFQLVLLLIASILFVGVTTPIVAQTGGLVAEREIHLSGVGGMALFRSEKNGLYPNDEFVVDEAQLFIEYRVASDTYFFAAINLAQREKGREKNHHRGNLNVGLGEIYVDFEQLDRFWAGTGVLNLRLGRLNIPFGEEYMVRDPMKNALIPPSLADFWGVDEGIEIYGSVGKWSYVLAVQNGGHAAGRDFDSDKAVTGRLSYAPASWLHLSLSGMRTGALTTEKKSISTDRLGELWFGNYWISSINGRTQDRSSVGQFSAHFFQGDAQIHFSDGHLLAFGGYGHYTDDRVDIDNGRDMGFYTVEGMKYLTTKLYGAVRWSHIMSKDGYLLVGLGDEERILKDIDSPTLTTKLYQASIGCGYKISKNLLIKTEYAWTDGTFFGGESRSLENMFSLELAFLFPQR